MKSDVILTEMELDALQETMNISFGSAAADLAEIMDIFIQLTVPEISAVKVSELSTALEESIPDFRSSSIVEQRYHGDFKGEALLVFPHGDEMDLISYFQHPSVQSFESDYLIDLEKEVLLEVGNILIGACIGRIFELLDSRISYFPPLILNGKDFDSSLLAIEVQPEDITIMMKTFFQFEDRDTRGYLFLVNSKESLPHLKKALNRFLGGE